MRYSNTGEGLHRFVDPADGNVYVYQHMFINNAGRILPAFDQPDLKASFRVRVTAPPNWRVATNGELVAPGRRRLGVRAHQADLDLPRRRCSPGRSTRAPTSTTASRWRSTCGPSLAGHLDAQAEEIFTITKQCLDRYHEMFDIRYPFGHYQQAFAPEFNFGAMEYPGLVIFRDELIYRSAVTDSQREHRANVIAHEMAHMWFGDLVTMAWWDDLWLNESFAEYLGTRVAAEATRFTGHLDHVRDAAQGLGAARRPAPVHPPGGARRGDRHRAALLNFDGISYAKGAAALKQLVAWVGDEAFLAGLNEHFAAHAYGNATLADLLARWPRRAAGSWPAWAEVWLRRAQVNTLRTEVEVRGRPYAAVAVLQTAPEAFPTLRPHKIGIGLFDRAPDGTMVRRKRIDVEVRRPRAHRGARAGR